MRLLVCSSLMIVIICVSRAYSGRHDPLQAYVVEGRLLVSGQPASNAALAFHPVGRNASNVVRPVAMTRPDGSFQLTTYRLGDGAPAGNYVVTVIWHDPSAPVDECECPDPTEHDQLCGHYANPQTSTLFATVQATKNQIVLTATPCSERERFERLLRRSGSRSVLGSFLGNEDQAPTPQRSAK